jgi:galactokinase
MGDHTDYNAGLVLPCAIDRYVLAGSSERADDEIHVLAIDPNSESDTFELNGLIEPHPSQFWSNYIRGAAHVLLDRGYTLSGCNIAVTGNVPQGAGLSSSAALAVSVLRAMAEVSKIQLQPVELALLAQAVENEFVGCACGIMDQLISVVGVKGSAIAIDCSDLSLTPTRIPESLSLLVINSNVQRVLADGEYNLRREQCDSAAHLLGQPNLRAVEAAELQKAESYMDPILVRRARHVLDENQRVLDLAAALEREDVVAVSCIMAASHLSLRKHFEVTVPEVDLLVDIVSDTLGDRGGVRMTGGGFGGCIVALLPGSLFGEVEQAVRRHYRCGGAVEASFYRVRPSEGLSLVI